MTRTRRHHNIYMIRIMIKKFLYSAVFKTWIATTTEIVNGNLIVLYTIFTNGSGMVPMLLFNVSVRLYSNIRYKHV